MPPVRDRVGSLQIGFKSLSQKDLKAILLKCNNPNRREGRPRKCRRLSDSPVDQILSSVPNTVKRINLVGNTTLGDAGTEHLHLLPSTVQDLDLSDCGLSSEGVKNICVYMATNTTIVRLVMWGNAIGDDGAEYVADMLCQNQTLRFLCIMDCGIGPNGFRHISRGLTHNSSLRDISIGSDENVRDDHMHMLAPGLAVNKGLEVLDLSITNISNQGLAHIEVALRENYYLKHVKMCQSFDDANFIPTGPGTTWHKVACWTDLNRRNRRALLQDQDVALSKWHEILTKCHDDGVLNAIYYFLRLKPEIICCR